MRSIPSNARLNRGCQPRLTDNKLVHVNVLLATVIVRDARVQLVEETLQSGWRHVGPEGQQELLQRTMTSEETPLSLAFISLSSRPPLHRHK